MAKLNKFATNLTLAQEGTEIDLGDGLIVRIAKANNANYSKYMKQVLKPYERQLRQKAGGLDDQIFERLYVEAIAETVWLGWRGLEDDNGVEIPYTKEKCIEILKDPQYDELKKLILGLAEESAVFAKEAVEDTKAV